MIFSSALHTTIGQNENDLEHGSVKHRAHSVSITRPMRFPSEVSVIPIGQY